jgi:uracil-DNA glycosylase
VLQVKAPLAEVVGRKHRGGYHGVEVDIIPLPHPSGASTWHKSEPGASLLTKALRLLAGHPDVKRAFG